MDLVASLGADVSDWSNFKGGPAKASANPKYCYEWAFVVPGSCLILNLWHASCRTENGRIVQRHNFRAYAQRNSEQGKGTQARRARTVEDAIRIAIRDRLLVRVILVEGRMRSADDPNGTASRVATRAIDPAPWRIAEYDPMTGECLISRDDGPRVYFDQFSLPARGNATPGKRSVVSSSYDRDSKVRDFALKRAAGRCEYCGNEGFALPGGGLFLETHHVIPLSEGGPDTVENVVALCPNHHREAHLGGLRDVLRRHLLDKLATIASA